MTNTQAITVDLAKIDYNAGEPYLHLNISAPHSYTFSQVHITVCTPKKEETYWNVIDNTIIGKKSAVTGIKLSDLFDDGNYQYSIFKIYLKAVPSYTAEKAANPEILYKPQIERELWVSDVHGVYRFLIDELLNSDDCSDISNEVIQKYLLLYGHQQALSEQDLSTAMEFFTLMHQGFTKCNNFSRTVSNCGCYGK